MSSASSSLVALDEHEPVAAGAGCASRFGCG